MNLSLLYSSVRYLQSFSIVSLARHIDDRCTVTKYNHNKLKRAFKLIDLEVIRSIIHLSKDTKLGNLLVRYIEHSDLVHVILEHRPALIHYDYDFVLRIYCEANDLEACKKIAKYNPDITVSDNYILRKVCNKYRNAKLLRWLFEELSVSKGSIKPDIDVSMFYAKGSYYGDKLKTMKVIMDYIDDFVPDIKYICYIKDYHEAYKMLRYVLDNRKVTKESITDTFHAACDVGNYDIVKFLLDTYGNVSCEALPFACFKSYYRIAKLLIDSNVTGQIDYSLELAIQNEDYSIVKLLIKAGANINNPTVAKKVLNCEDKKIERLYMKYIDRYRRYISLKEDLLSCDNNYRRDRRNDNFRNSDSDSDNDRRNDNFRNDNDYRRDSDDVRRSYDYRSDSYE